MRLYLVRHAMVDIRSDVLPKHWHLSPEGRAAASALAEDPCWANVTLVYTSPEPKAVATAQRIAAPHRLPIAIEHDLREVGGRPWTEREEHWEHVRRFFAGDALDGWEARAAALDRIRGAIDPIVQRHAGEDVAVVSHGLALALWFSDLVGVDAHELHVRLRNPDLAIVDPKARRFERDFGG